jgi:dihydrofolate synthase/folylpolyglutamate synthase
MLGYWWFAERDVDIAVVEVGAGGRFDATNVIDPVVSVITSVGLDHIITLGPTIADIAWHKAGIIKPGATAVVGDVPDEAFAVIAREADAARVKIERPNESGAPLPWLPRMPGVFQRRNAEVAVAVARCLCQQGFNIPDSAIVHGIKEARLPGRLEQMPDVPIANNPAVWIDGAHNAEKIAALSQEIVKLSGNGPLPVIVLGVLRAKDPAAIVSGLRSAASSMVLTEPCVFGKSSLAANALASSLAATGYTGNMYVEPNAETALLCARQVARACGAPVVVTGSMYLAGQVRRRWYRDEDIVLARTPWSTPSIESCLSPP